MRAFNRLVRAILIIGAAARLIGSASADPVDAVDGVIVHELAPLVHVIAGVGTEFGPRWQHQSDGRIISWQPSTGGEHPDSVYFYPAQDRWYALPYQGVSTGWASCAGLMYGLWRSWEDEAGYIALPRAMAARLAVCFVYIDEDGNWLGAYDWQIRQHRYEP
jgi:hypothetical protein